MRRGTRRVTRRKLRGGGGGSSKPAAAPTPVPNSHNRTARQAARAEERAARQEDRAAAKEARASARDLNRSARQMERDMKAMERNAAKAVRTAKLEEYKKQQLQIHIKEFFSSGIFDHLPEEEKKEAIKNAAMVATMANAATWLTVQSLQTNSNNAALQAELNALGAGQ